MSKDDFEIYNGVRVIPGWGKEIEYAQTRPTTTINEQLVDRTRYGSETKDLGTNGETCEECAAMKGQLHVMGCDFEQCPICGGQFLYCDCANEENM